MKYARKVMRLAKKIRQYEKMIEKNPRYVGGFTKPGSLKKV